MRSVLVLLFAALTAAACAESPKHAQQPGSGSGSGSDVVCSEVSDTGSMFSHTECKPREQQQNERDDAQRWIKQPRSQPSASH